MTSSTGVGRYCISVHSRQAQTQWERFGAIRVAITGRGSQPAAGAIRDDDGALTRWLRGKKAGRGGAAA